MVFQWNRIAMNRAAAATAAAAVAAATGGASTAATTTVTTASILLASSFIMNHDDDDDGKEENNNSFASLLRNQQYNNNNSNNNKYYITSNERSSLLSNLGGGGGRSVKKNETNNNKLVPIKCADGTQVIPYQAPSRETQIKRLKTEEFDILVIGGGCVGSGIALDASMRGLNVALIESDDFGSGTSGRSTKLIHGGIRYLENAFKHFDLGEYELVREALEERKHMLKAAPYMNKPLPIMIPMYQYNWYDIFLVPYYLMGVWVYDFVAGKNSGVPNSHFISREEALFQFPMLKPNKLLGAIVYYDGQMNDSRMCLHLALTSTQKGCAIASRIQVMKLLHDTQTSRLNGAIVKNNYSEKGEEEEEFVIKARCIVNATGPFVDTIRKMDDPEIKPMIKGAAGVHVLLPDHYSPTKMGLIVPKTKDGRVLFFLPWEGGTIAGTTDSESDLTMTPRPSDREIGFILEESNNYLRKDKSVSTNQVRAAWSGIRPLVIMDPSSSSSLSSISSSSSSNSSDEKEKQTKDTKSISRSHVITVSEPGKLITIAGGKWTTYRKMAEDTVDKVLDEIPDCMEGRPVNRECETKEAGIIGADRAGVVTGKGGESGGGNKFDRVVVTLREDYGLPKDVAYHLVHNYGTRALQIAEITRSQSPVFDRRVVSSLGEVRRICTKYPYIEAEIKFAIEQEYALTPIDVLARRTRLAFIDSEAAKISTPRVVKLMGDYLGWNKKRRKEEENKCLIWLQSMNMKNK